MVRDPFLDVCTNMDNRHYVHRFYHRYACSWCCPVVRIRVLGLQVRPQSCHSVPVHQEQDSCYWVAHWFLRLCTSPKTDRPFVHHLYIPVCRYHSTSRFYIFSSSSSSSNLGPLSTRTTSCRLRPSHLHSSASLLDLVWYTSGDTRSLLLSDWQSARCRLRFFYLI